MKDTTTGKTYSGGYIKVYQDHGATPNGDNMVINSGGGMFLGSGESPSSHYSAKGSTYNGEDCFITADGNMHLQANGNTIANRKGLQITNEFALVPEQADVATDNVGSIGTSSYRWANGHFTKINGVTVGSTPVFTDTKNTAGSTNNTDLLYLVGATEQSNNPQTYSNDYIFISENHLYSHGYQVVNITDQQTLYNKTIEDGFFYKTSTTQSSLEFPDILLTEEFINTNKYVYRMYMTPYQIYHQSTTYNGNTDSIKIRDTISIGLNGNITITNNNNSTTDFQGRTLVLGSGSVLTSNSDGTRTTSIVEGGLTNLAITTNSLTSTSAYVKNLYSTNGNIVIGDSLTFSANTYIQMADKIAMQVNKVNNVSQFSLGIDTLKLVLYGTSYYLSTGAAITSDKRLKTNIEVMDNRYLNFIKDLEPKRFKLKNNEDQKYHTGFIAQDVKDLLQKYNISEKEFAAFARPKNDDSEYALSYTEFIPLLLLYIKNLEKQLNKIKEQQ